VVKISNLGVCIFKGLGMKNLVHVIAIWYSLLQFGVFCCHLIRIFSFWYAIPIKMRQDGHLDGGDGVSGQDDQERRDDHDDEQQEDAPDLRNVGRAKVAIRKFLASMLSSIFSPIFAQKWRFRPKMAISPKNGDFEL
jgi:hypothetical protein